MNYYFDCFKKYADFNGRSGRKEYWLFALFNFIALVVVSTIDFTIGSFPTLYALYLLAALIPGLAVTVRRLHDINKSGWFLLICLIPLIGGIWLLVLMVKESDRGTNNYGDDQRFTKQTQQEEREKNKGTIVW